MIHQEFIEAVEDSPVIAAVKDMEGLRRCFDSESKVVFILFGDVCNIADIVEKHFDLRPAAIIRDLDLRRPIYRKTAAYGHFGRTDVDFPWEHLDKVEELKAYLK